jgi:quinol monooxygenase YgiN
LSDPTYTTIATWYVKDDLERARAALEELAVGVRDEAGTLLYFIHHEAPTSLPPAPPTKIVFVEMYEDEAAFEAHLAGPAFAAFKKKYADLFVLDPKTGEPFVEHADLRRIAGFARTAVSRIDPPTSAAAAAS